MEIKLHVDIKNYDHKPTDNIGEVKARLQKSTPPSVISLEEVIKKVANGHAISPAVMSGGARAENWTQQQLFCVDIDNDAEDIPVLVPEEAIKICAKNNLPVAFWYPTYSHTEEKPKFRLCFVCTECITDLVKRSIIMNSIVSLFSQADKACVNADRIFFGTNKSPYIIDVNAQFKCSDIIGLYSFKARKAGEQSKKDAFLAKLIDGFDLFSYMKETCGDIASENSEYAMFRECPICGHRDDLVYYKNPNSFYCFGKYGRVGGTIIDFLMHSEGLTLVQAIKKLKQMSGVQSPTTGKKLYGIHPYIDKQIDFQNVLKELQPHLTYSHDDKGNGELFADVFKDCLRYNVTAKEWYFYNGIIWMTDVESMETNKCAKRLIDELVRYAADIDDPDGKYTIFLGSLRKQNNRNRMIEDARDKFYIKDEQLDKNPYLLNCQNGILDLKTFEFREHNSNDMLSKVCNAVYNDKAKSKDFEKFIDQIMMSDKNKIDFIQKILGYSLTGDTSLEKGFILYGPTTRNGKSTLMETIAYMLGNDKGYAMHIQPETLARRSYKDSRQASGDIARLKGCRFLNASEPPKKMAFDSALLKNLLGRDSITARHVYEKDFEFLPEFTLFINSNYLPEIDDPTLFESERLVVIPFDRHFDVKEQDKTLKERLKSEENISGVLNWCIEGLKKFNTEDFEIPGLIKDATMEYRSISDQIGNFLFDCLKSSKDNIKAKDVYNAYCEWCKENDCSGKGKLEFYAELRVKGILSKKGTVNGVTYDNVVKGHAFKGAAYGVGQQKNCIPFKWTE